MRPCIAIWNSTFACGAAAAMVSTLVSANAIATTAPNSAALAALGPALMAYQDGDDAVAEAQSFERQLRIFEAAALLNSQASRAFASDGLRVFRAWFLHRYHFHEDAIAAFEEVLANAEDSRPIHEALGWDYRAVGKSQEAKRHLAHVYASPVETFSDAQVFAHFAQQAQRQVEQQIAQARAALAEMPNDIPRQKRVLEVYGYGGNHNDAIDLADQILASDPSDVLVQLARVTALEGAARHSEAAAALESMLKARPENAYLWYRLGRVQAALKKYDAATQSFQRAHELFSTSVHIRRQLAEMLAVQDRYEEAVAAAPQENEPAGQSLEARLARAHVRHFSGHLSAAVPIYRDILREYPHNADALKGLSEALVLTGRQREAVHIIAQAQQAGFGYAVQQSVQRMHDQPVLRAGAFSSAYLNSEQFRRYDGGFFIWWQVTSDMAIEGQYQFSRFAQKRFTSIDRHLAWIGAQWRFSDDAEIHGRIGASFYEGGNENLYARAGGSWRCVDGLTLALDYEHLDVTDIETSGDFHIFNQATIGAAALGLDAHQITPSIHVKPDDRIDWHTQLSWSDYSDGNERLSWWTEVLYRLCDEPLVQVGYNYYYLNLDMPAPLFTQNSRTVSAYFDPTDFEAHSLVFRVAHDLSAKWQVGVEERLSHIPKADGIGTGTFVFLAWKLNEQVRLRGDARYFHQSQGVSRAGPSGAFDAAQFVLGLEGTF